MKGKRHGVLPAFLVALCVFLFGVNAWASVVPPKPSTPVYDGAGVLTPQQKTDLENKLVRFKQQNGPEVAVAILPTIGDESIDDVRYDIFNAWGIGDKERKDGVLLLIVVDKSKAGTPGQSCGCVALEIGEYVESVWTDTQSKRILVDTVRPRAIGGDFYDAANSGVDMVLGAFTDTDAAREYKQDSDSGGIAKEKTEPGVHWWVWLLLIGFAVLLQLLGVPVLEILLIILSAGRGGGGGSSFGGGGGSFGGGGSSGGGGASA